MAPKAEPLTLEEVLQLRDGMKITRLTNPALPSTIALLPLSINIKPLYSLN